MSRERRFYVDSAQVDEVAEVLRDRLVHGVTTNPTILERAHRSSADSPALYARWISEGAEEVFFQAWGDSIQTLLHTAHGILALGPKVVVKVPATRAGFAAAADLSRGGATVLLTAVYSPAQALVAASLGVRYVAPYLGRMQDRGLDGIAEISVMTALVADTGTDVLAASLRSPEAIVALAAVGVSYFTAAPAVILAMLQHELSESSNAEFEAAVARGHFRAHSQH
ncbi:transaldolase family protein [Cryobacterium gelidum]|uniref:Transaldolase n=1 Tax=Cryobacterium gelidum TaxID=1259164 RepID=A0A4R9AVI6_9MICO|nr:transaldolase family protein [Cryobacterium gelidum]TFD70846.1 transaldolase [Cryobacterium gelidum]